MTHDRTRTPRATRLGRRRPSDRRQAPSHDRYRTEPPDRWQQWAATLLLGLGSLPLLFSLRPQIGLFVLALLLISGAAIRWPGLQPNRVALLALTLLGGLNVLQAYHSLVGQYAGSALLLTMVTLKRLETRTRRDLRVLMSAFGFLLAIQFLFSESPWLLLWLSLMLVGAVALLADLAAAPREASDRWRQWQRGGRLALVLCLQSVPLALVLFVLFPRLDAPLWDLGLGDRRGVTGLKDWMEPGSISELIISGEDAFRVRFEPGSEPNIPSAQFYWRGPVLWHTNGRRWLPRYRAEDPPRPDAAQRMPMRTTRGDPIRYSVMLEPTDQRWLFALELPTVLPKRARLTPDFQLIAAEPVKDLKRYQASSVLDAEFRDLHPSHRAAALQLPPTVTPRMRELVANWRAQAGSPQATGGQGLGGPATSEPTAQGAARTDPATLDRAVVQQALRFFNEPPFRYTLLPPRLGANPADEFLFETQAGFCEHYASSFVLLMRLAAIPARIVTGYLGGDYNPLSGDYLVRQSDAHAWAEVWLEGSGWTRVDPTAAIASERVERDPRMTALGRSAPVRFQIDDQGALAGLIRGARLFADALDSGWKNWVLGFSRTDQLQLLDRLGLGALREYGLAILMVIAASVVMLAWALALARAPKPSDPVQRCWHRFGRRLARVGLAPGRHEGPLHYRNRIIASRPDLRPAVTTIVSRYLALRYRQTAAPTEHRQLCSAVQRFRPRAHARRRSR